jgi:hypothetical protein
MDVVVKEHSEFKGKFVSLNEYNGMKCLQYLKNNKICEDEYKEYDKNVLTQLTMSLNFTNDEDMCLLAYLMWNSRQSDMKELFNDKKFVDEFKLMDKLKSVRNKISKDHPQLTDDADVILEILKKRISDAQESLKSYLEEIKGIDGVDLSIVYLPKKEIIIVDTKTQINKKLDELRLIENKVCEKKMEIINKIEEKKLKKPGLLCGLKNGFKCHGSYDYNNKDPPEKIVCQKHKKLTNDEIILELIENNISKYVIEFNRCIEIESRVLGVKTLKNEEIKRNTCELKELEKKLLEIQKILIHKHMDALRTELEEEEYCIIDSHKTASEEKKEVKAPEVRSLEPERLSKVSNKEYYFTYEQEIELEDSDRERPQKMGSLLTTFKTIQILKPQYYSVLKFIGQFTKHQEIFDMCLSLLTVMSIGNSEGYIYYDNIPYLLNFNSNVNTENNLFKTNHGFKSNYNEFYMPVYNNNKSAYDYGNKIRATLYKLIKINNHSVLSITWFVKCVGDTIARFNERFNDIKDLQYYLNLDEKDEDDRKIIQTCIDISNIEYKVSPEVQKKHCKYDNHSIDHILSFIDNKICESSDIGDIISDAYTYLNDEEWNGEDYKQIKILIIELYKRKIINNDDYYSHGLLRHTVNNGMFLFTKYLVEIIKIPTRNLPRWNYSFNSLQLINILNEDCDIHRYKGKELEKRKENRNKIKQYLIKNDFIDEIPEHCEMFEQDVELHKRKDDVLDLVAD